MADLLLLPPLTPGLTVGEFIVFSFSGDELQLRDRIRMTLLFCLPAIPAPILGIYLLTAATDHYLVVLAAICFIYTVFAFYLLITRLGLVYVFTRASRDVIAKRPFRKPRIVAVNSVAAINFRFIESRSETPSDHCRLDIEDARGKTLLRIQGGNPARMDIGPLLSLTATIADLLDVPAAVSGTPLHLDIPRAQRIAAQVAYFHSYLNGEVNTKAIVPERVREPAPLRRFAIATWSELENPLLALLLVINVFALYKGLGLAGMDADTRNDFFLFLCLVCIGLTVAEFEWVKRLLGGRSWWLKSKGFVSLPIMILIWLSLTVATGLFNRSTHNSRLATARQEAERRNLRDQLNSPEVKQALQDLEKYQSQKSRKNAARP